MSFIAGFVDRAGRDDSSALVRTMLAGVGERVPDGIVVEDAPGCSLGIARLITTSAGVGIGCYRSSQVGVVLDGRLDNGGDLRSSLGLEAEVSDAAVVGAGYLRHGVDCFARIRGEFAAIIWDAGSRTLVAARDSFGVRPLCFAQSGAQLAVASDPEQLLMAGIISTAPDDDAVVDYLLWKPRHADRTFFRDARSVPAGHLLVVDRRSVRITRYRSPALANVRLASREDYWAEYRTRFKRAIRSRLESPFPVVAELSGGIDSSSIVCVSDRILAEQEGTAYPSLIAAAGVYPGLPCDEEPYIRAVAEHVRIPVQRWNASTSTVDELADSSLSMPAGGVMTFGGSVGQLDIAASYGARVLLSGIGGDQVGSPAGGIRDAITELRWNDAARMIFQRPSVSIRSVVGVARALARSFVPMSIRRMRANRRVLDERPEWFSDWARRFPRLPVDIAYPEELGSEIQRRIWRSLTSGPHALLMTYAQHPAMDRAIDVRFPFLDVDLVALVLSIPSRFWPPPWPFERLHREILRDDLPAAIASRRGKAHFESAVLLRVRRHLPAIRDLFSPAAWRSEKYVSYQAAVRLMRLFESLESPDFRTTYSLWAVATLEAWLGAISRYSTGPRRP